MNHWVCGVIGSGAMGTGIAQVASLAGWEVRIYDKDIAATNRSKDKLLAILNRLAVKRKITDEEAKDAFGRIYYVDDLETMAGVDLVIEAIVEDLEIKQSVFKVIEPIIGEKAILASNTSSLSITSLASVLSDPSRMVGIHFFNPPGLMKLVEVVPGLLTSSQVVENSCEVIQSWGKEVATAKDTPGFIVNKVARPFYGEALRIYEEGLATPGEIDWIMTQVGGFRMGPFTLMDYIGHDVNYTVTETVWKAFYYDPRYKPSLAQKKLVEAELLGRKKGRGFFDYRDSDEVTLIPVKDDRAHNIFKRILFMLINEAADTIYYKICSEENVELAMLKGVNYPKGLLAWGEEYGWENICSFLNDLYNYYHEERYRVSPYIINKISNDKF